MTTIMQLINELSKVDDLIFVGGASLFIQGVQSEISDIDVLVKSIGPIRNSFEITFIDEPLYKLNSRQRAYFIQDGIMVDIFIQENNEEMIVVNNCKCTTIKSEIQFLEMTLGINLSNENKKSTVAKINKLKSIIR